MQHAVTASHAAKGKLLGRALITRADAASWDVAYVAAILDLAADQPFGGAKFRPVQKMRKLDDPCKSGFRQAPDRLRRIAGIADINRSRSRLH
jgi:hypothetical protein